MARVVYNFADHGGEKSSVGMNLDAVANEGALRTAVGNVSIGQMQKATVIDSVANISSSNAASQWAQVELGLRITINDPTTGEQGYLTIPCPDLNNLTVIEDLVTLADGSIMAALVTQIEAHVESRDNNPVTVERAEIVGRNR